MSLLPCMRDDFDIPADVTYLNCAYMSPLSKRVMAAGRRAIEGKSHPWQIKPSDFFTYPDTARDQFARIVGADSEGVAIVPAASYGMATAAKNLLLAAGEEIVVLKDQMPANIYPWQRLAKDNSAKVQMLTRGSGESWTELLLNAIGKQTAIVAIPHVHWTDGALIDLDCVSKACRAQGAALVLDLTQSAGAMPTNLAAIEPDFAVAACYKWLMGPYAVGFLWIHPRWRNGIPVEEGWISRKGAEDFSRLVDYQDDYEPGARRFDMGERAQHQLLPMAMEGMQQLLDWGVENLHETLTASTVEIAERAAPLGFSAPQVGDRAGHYLGLLSERALPKDLVQRMAVHNVYLSVRGPCVRITPHIYNTNEDIERLVDALARETG